MIITQYVSLCIFHSAAHTAPGAFYTFLSIFINELLHELVLLLLYARFLLILASTALWLPSFVLRYFNTLPVGNLPSSPSLVTLLSIGITSFLNVLLRYLCLLNPDLVFFPYSSAALTKNGL